MKYHVPRIDRITLNILGCGVEIWTMQGVEHRNKQSKHACSHKKNGKGNFCKQVLKVMHQDFLNN